MSTIEIELRFKINDFENLPDLETKLVASGFSPESESDITDEYYCPTSVNSFDEIAMNNVGSYSLRVRKEKVGPEICDTINMKVIVKEGDHGAWKEIETVVGDLNAIKMMLGTLGYKIFFTLGKHRKSFYNQEKNIRAFIEIINGKYFVELEKVVLTSGQEEIEAQKTVIGNFARELGLQDPLKGSITNSLMKEESKF